MSPKAEVLGLTSEERAVALKLSAALCWWHNSSPCRYGHMAAISPNNRCANYSFLLFSPLCQISFWNRADWVNFPCCCHTQVVSMACRKLLFHHNRPQSEVSSDNAGCHLMHRLFASLILCCCCCRFSSFFQHSTLRKH